MIAWQPQRSPYSRGPRGSRPAGNLRRSLKDVSAIVRRGGVVGYAVEACFGLGCDPRNRRAVQRLLRLKRRPAAKGLILIASGPEALRRYTQDLPAQVLSTWPGPHTWLVDARPALPAIVRGRHATVAVRVTAHSQAARLARLSGGTLISTSANRAHQKPTRHYRELCRRLGRDLDAVLVGRIGTLARPTRIRDARTGRTIRA